DDEGLARIGVEEDDSNLAAITGVDQARGVDDGDAVPRGEPRAGLDAPCEALGDRDGEPRSNHGPLPRFELVPVARGEIEARVTGVRALGEGRLGAKAADRELDHALDCAGASDSRGSTIRYGAKRRTSLRGRRARTKTPSGRSARSSTGAPSAYSSARRAPSSYGISSRTG